MKVEEVAAKLTHGGHAKWHGADPACRDCYNVIVALTAAQAEARAERDAEVAALKYRLKLLGAAARALLLTYMRPTDPTWCGCCSSSLGEHRPDCAAAAVVRALLEGK